MRNKGFTLIELLAVIVILAIIALIATPIILGIINDARKSAKERSAELVYTGVEYAYTTAMYKGTSGTSIADPTLETIKNNLSIDNMKTATLNTEKAELTIETNDGVTCNVTGNATNGFEVECPGYMTTKSIAKVTSN